MTTRKMRWWHWMLVVFAALWAYNALAGPPAPPSDWSVCERQADDGHIGRTPVDAAEGGSDYRTLWIINCVDERKLIRALEN